MKPNRPVELLVFSKPPVPNDVTVPFAWGNVVTFGENLTKEIITLPDNNLGEALTVDFNRAQMGTISWPSARAWKDLRLQADTSSLPLQVVLLLIPYHDSVSINAFHGYTSTQFVIPS